MKFPIFSALPHGRLFLRNPPRRTMRPVAWTCNISPDRLHSELEVAGQIEKGAQMLEAAVFLGVLDEPDVEWLVANSKQHELQSGSVLIHRGEAVEFLYLIVDGAFDVKLFSPKPRHIATL